MTRDEAALRPAALSSTIRSMNDSRPQSPAPSTNPARSGVETETVVEKPSAGATDLAERAAALGADGATPLWAREIVTAEWVLMKCRFGCPDYGKRRTCPPHTPNADGFRAVLAGYESALLVWVEAGGGDGLSRARRRLHEAILALEREAFLAGAFKAFGLVDGTCLWCADELCAPAACRHPDKVRPSLAGCGVDAFATAAAAGIEMHVASDRGEAYRLLGLLLIA
jgi:predicted metal-binding protein